MAMLPSSSVIKRKVTSPIERIGVVGVHVRVLDDGLYANAPLTGPLKESVISDCWMNRVTSRLRLIPEAELCQPTRAALRLRGGSERPEIDNNRRKELYERRSPIRPHEAASEAILARLQGSRTGPI
jgi:hypothetical protein